MIEYLGPIPRDLSTFNLQHYFRDLVDPSALPPSDITRYVICGDLHGCALKLLHLVLDLQICKMDGYELTRFTEFYMEQNVRFESGLFLETNYQITSLRQVYSSRIPLVILLLGDVVYDRGKSDFLTLYVLSKITEAGISIQCLLGNHDLLLMLVFGSVLPNGSNQSLNHHINLNILQRPNFSGIWCIFNCQEPLFKASYRSWEGAPNFGLERERWTPPEFKIKYTTLFHNYLNRVVLLRYLQLLETSSFNEDVPYNTLLCSHAPFRQDIFNTLCDTLFDMYNSDMAKEQLKFPRSMTRTGIQVVNRLIQNLLKGIVSVPGNPYTAADAAAHLLIEDMKLDANRDYIMSAFVGDEDENNSLRSFLENRETPPFLYPPNTLNVHGHLGFTGSKVFERRLNLDSSYGRPNAEKNPRYFFTPDETEVIGITEPPASPSDELIILCCLVVSRDHD